MLKGRRVKRKTTSKPLTLTNPFRSTSYNRYKLNREFVGPVKSKYGDPISKLSIDQEKLKKMQKLGLIPDTLGVQMRQYTGNSTATSQGVSSLQALSDEQDLARQVEMFNAGILSKKQQKLKSLLALAKKKKKYDFDKKVVEWLATAKEIEQIPPELIEDVRKYWKEEKGFTDERRIDEEMQKVAATRRDYAQEKLREKEEKGKRRGYFEQPRFNTLQPRIGTSLRYSDNNGLLPPLDTLQPRIATSLRYSDPSKILSTSLPPTGTYAEREADWERFNNVDNMELRAKAFFKYVSGQPEGSFEDELKNYMSAFKPNNTDAQAAFLTALRDLMTRAGPPPGPQSDKVTETLSLLNTNPETYAHLLYDDTLSDDIKEAVIRQLYKLNVTILNRLDKKLKADGHSLKGFHFDTELFSGEQRQIQGAIKEIKKKLQEYKNDPVQAYAYLRNLVRDLQARFSPSQREFITNRISPDFGRLLNRIAALFDLRLNLKTDKKRAEVINWAFEHFGRYNGMEIMTDIFHQILPLNREQKDSLIPKLDTEIVDLYNSFEYEMLRRRALEQQTPTPMDTDHDDETEPPKLSTIGTTSVERIEDPEQPSTVAGTGYLGWRAPRLHRLVRPYKPFMLTETPEEIIDEEKHELDDRRAKYKDYQLFQRGLAPPKDMVDRAMPKTAKPLIHVPVTIPFTGVVPHPFIFPDKKYFIQPGL